MGRPDAASFVDALLAAPAGVALLASLEPREVKGLSFPQLVAAAVAAAHYIAGPWAGDGPALLAAAYRGAPARRAIAETVAEQFSDELHAPVDLGAQQWWHSNTPSAGHFAKRLFVDFEAVYGNGEFTWAGLRTATAPPPEAHDELVGAWEIYPGPVSRWQLPVRTEARVWEIHRPLDWARLVQRYPRVAAGPHRGWELPGPNQRVLEVEPLLGLPAQNAARARIDRHLLPDWSAVACDYDGVHLSWAGFLSTEGYVSDLDGGGVTMLRYWDSERTLWLADVFGEPVPLEEPVLSGRINGDRGVDVRTDEGRRRQDLEVLTALLGR